jgi:hypothetical protein
MAGLFGGVEAPQYVGPNGTAVATKQSAGLFGVFPGTPDYTTAPPPNVPPSDPPIPPVVPATPGIEVTLKVPGLVNLQASLWLPPWLRESAPTLVPILLHLLRQRIEGDLCRAAQAAGIRSDGTEYESPRDPGYERPETEARVWDRE